MKKKPFIWKHKFIVLLLSTCLLLFLAYITLFSPMIDEIHRYRQMSRSSQNVRVPVRPASAQMTDPRVLTDTVMLNGRMNALLDAVMHRSVERTVNIVEVGEPKIWDVQHYRVQQFEISATGSFVDLVYFLNDMENISDSVGTPIAVIFFTDVHQEPSARDLTCTIVIKNISLLQ